jgi:MFS family permease
MPHFETAYGTPDSASASGASLSAHRQSVVVALLSAGCFAGALLGVPTADWLGRRGAIFMVSVIFIIGVIVQIAPTGNLGAFLAGRFVAGLGVGVSLLSWDSFFS